MSRIVIVVDGSERPLEFAKLVRSVVERSLGQVLETMRVKKALTTVALFGNDHPEAARRLRAILDCAEQTGTSLRIFKLLADDELTDSPPASCEVTRSYLLNVLDEAEGHYA